MANGRKAGKRCGESVEQKVTFELRRKGYEECASLCFMPRESIPDRKQQEQRLERGVHPLPRGGQR